MSVAESGSDRGSNRSAGGSIRLSIIITTSYTHRIFPSECIKMVLYTRPGYFLRKFNGKLDQLPQSGPRTTGRC